MNFIFSPSQKFFILPILLIVNYYREKSEPVKVICDESTKHMFDFYLLNDEDLIIIDEISFSDGDNFVFFQHNTPGAINFYKRKVTEISESIRSFSLSFMPDGLGNAMYGDAYLDLAKDIIGKHQEISLKDVFSFGFVHSTILQRYNLEHIRTLSYEKLDSHLLKALEYIKLDELKALLSNCENVIVIPFRPWSTDFHGGVYSVGSEGGVGVVYNRLIADISDRYLNKVASGNSDNLPLVLFRGDPRYPDSSKAVFDLISSENKLCIDGYIDDRMTLESFLYALLNQFNVNSYFITLDSTTFQAVPFLKRSNNYQVVGSIGCFTYLIKDFSGDDDQFYKKIIGKSKDFKNRYLSMSERNTQILDVTSSDEGHFYVEAK